MTLAFDAFTSAVVNAGNSFTHTPVGTPRAVLLFIVKSGSSDTIDAPTYGGVAMAEVTGSPNIKATGEAGQVHVFFLGSSVPTGTKTIANIKTGFDNHLCYCLTYTAADDCEVQATDASISTDSDANPSATLGLSGEECAVALGFFSGRDFSSQTTPLTDWTSRGEHQGGTYSTGAYTYDTVGTSDVTIGWTQSAADDAVCIGVAIRESGGCVPPVITVSPTVSYPGGLNRAGPDAPTFVVTWTAP